MAFHSNKVKAKIIKSAFACQRDGLTIRGTEYRPEGDCLPVAVVSHGFMAFQDTVRQYAVALAKMGYVSYCFDFCGGCVIKGKSDGRTTEMSVLTEVKDLEAVIQYARGREYGNPEEILRSDNIALYHGNIPRFCPVKSSPQEKSIQPFPMRKP